MQIHKKLKLVFVGSCVTVSSVLLASCNGGSTAQVSLPDGQGNNDTPLAKALTTDLEWAELAQQREAITLPIQQDHPTDQNNVLGRWGTSIDWPHVAAGAASLPSGRIASWASSTPDDFRSGGDSTYTTIYDPVTESFADSINDGHDLFGASVAKTSDGRTIAIGGSRGVTTTSVLDGNGWSTVDELPKPRAFGQATALADGTLIALGSRTEPVQWRAARGWSEVTGAMATDLAALPQASLDQLDGSAAMVVAPDGRLFTAGSGEESFSLDLHGGYQAHGAQSADNADRLYGTTVMYDVGKLLVAGGGRPSLSSAVTIDINGTAPVVTPTGSLHSPRSMHNSVLLPDGQVMVLGGTEAGIPFSDESSLFEPELWNPVSAQWQKLAPHGFPRNYQSTALLMKDARVVAMGGGLCGDCASNYQSAEIFEPPYLFNTDGTAAARPDIISAPTQATVGDTVVVSASVSTGAAIERFNLLRISAVTRHHNGDQRLVPVSMSSVAANDFELYLSQNANVLLPGAYWLYAIDSQGVPSIGHTIQILSATEAEQGTAPQAPEQELPEPEQEQEQPENESEQEQAVITPAADAQACATHGQLCVLPVKALATVWYGNNGNWAVVSGVSDAILCDAETFGTDASAEDKICTFLVTGESPDASQPDTDVDTDETDNAATDEQDTGDDVSDNDSTDDNTDDNTDDSGDNTLVRALPVGSLFQHGDVLALHYDVAADIDDIHAIASGKSIVAFYDIAPAVVVGTYGFDNNRRETYHVKFKDLTRKEAANHVATLAYGSDGYLDTKGYQADLEIAAQAQAAIWKKALDAGNDIWVAEGGPSDFTEEVMQQLLQQGVTLATLQSKVHVVQHSIAANEGNTDDESLAFVKANTDYITLQNGNQPNATADLNTGVAVDDYFRNWASNSAHPAAWEFSMVYFEEKLDFSDTVEILHILNIGTDMIADTNDFADFFD